MARKPARPAWLVLFVLGAAAIALLFLWLFPLLLTRHAPGTMTTAERLKAVNDVRTPLVAFLIALGAGGTLWFTAQSYRLNREGHVTDRYTKAVGQLGDADSPVRIGGVYALERIGRDSPKDQVTIVYVLGAFIRERARVMRERQDEPAEDVRAALRVAARLLALCEAKLDLRGADLRNADLRGLSPDRVLLEGANIEGALFSQE
jgi:hypothetical protein